MEAKVLIGPITTLNLTQTGDGNLKFIISEGESTSGRIMTIGNTQTPVKFREHPVHGKMVHGSADPSLRHLRRTKR